MANVNVNGVSEIQNNGDDLSYVIIAASVRNQTTNTWYDLPYYKKTGFAYLATATYNNTFTVNLPAGIYDGRFSVYLSETTAGTALGGGYFSGGTLANRVLISDIASAFQVTALVSIAFLSSTMNLS